MQYARVPTELVEQVDAPALQLYVALCGYARRGGYCYPSNAELSRATGQSDRTVTRSLNALVATGHVTRTGRQRRMLRVVPIESLSATPDGKTPGLSATSGGTFPPPVADVSTCTEVEKDTLTDVRVSAAEESETDLMDDEPLFEIEQPAKPPAVGTTLAMRSFFDAYGKEPLSRSMIGRLGKTFKTLCETYPDELVAEAAREMGLQQCANPNAAESFVLRIRSRAVRVNTSSDAAWSALAADTFAQWKGEAQKM